VDMIAYESLQMNFADVLASSDAVITKPGYGTFTEAAYAGVPVLYVTRRDWPEEPYLVRWLKENGTCLEVDRAVLHKGELDLVLQQLWSQGLPPRPNADGASQAARLLLEKLI
jgi:UDP-N-acetylglucosamine:LPS N-acetylglucosamine transferase